MKFKLDKELFLRQIALCEPDLPFDSVDTNNEGLVNSVLIVNGRRVFRFPKHDWAVDHLWQEARCLALARRHLAMPLPKWQVYAGEIFGAPFVGYDLIPGRALTRHQLLRLAPAEQQALAEQLGTFLHQLHAIPVAEVKAAGIRPSVTNRTAEAWHRLYENVEKMLFPYLMALARDWVQQHFAPLLNKPDFMAYDPVFINGDLGGYHLLYNAESRRLNGIIDFGTAGLGDPATDFACLLDQFGETFVRQMSPFYPNLSLHIERARFWAGTLELQWLLSGLRYPDEPGWFMVHLGRARDVLPIGSGW